MSTPMPSNDIIVKQLLKLEDNHKKLEGKFAKITKLLSRLLKTKISTTNSNLSSINNSTDEQKCSSTFPKFVNGGPEGFSEFLKTTFRKILEESFTEYSTIHKMRYLSLFN
jgi:hypothetical protein